MAKGEHQKIKLVRLLEILKGESDENNPLSSTYIMEKLKKQGIDCARKALYSDIELLNDYGYEIMTIKGRQNMYYVTDREFDVAELRILMDAVQSSVFITSKKTKELTNKISALAGSHRAELLRQNTVSFDTVKNTNECVYYSVDAIDRAIVEGKKVSFVYFDYAIDGSKDYRKNAERYIVNPVGLIFSNGFYYLVCYSDKYKELTNYRVDRMERVEVESADIKKADCISRFESYKKENLAFSMFPGKVEIVSLLVDNSLTDMIFDKFGRQITLKKADEEHFIVKVKVQISPVFLGWCAMFGQRLKILSPKTLSNELVDFLKTTLSQYSQD